MGERKERDKGKEEEMENEMLKRVMLIVRAQITKMIRATSKRYN